ncbi:MAG: hypothetical protein U0791_23330 [Gemmataceae bacterium]
MSKRTLKRPYKGAHRVNGYCAGCSRNREHIRKVLQGADGNCYAVWVCTHDGTSFLAGGFCCWSCGHHRFKVAWVRSSRPGEVTRVKKCRQCGTRHETGEQVKRIVRLKEIGSPEAATGRPN